MFLKYNIFELGWIVSFISWALFIKVDNHINCLQTLPVKRLTTDLVRFVF